MIPLIFLVVIVSALGSKAGPVDEGYDGKPSSSVSWYLEKILAGLNPFILRATPRPPPASVVDYCVDVPADKIYDLPDYIDCHAFWRCEVSLPVWHQCPLMDSENRMVFNPPQQRCDPPWQYPCQFTTTMTTLTTTTELSTTTTTASTSTSTSSVPPTGTSPTDPTIDGSSTPITTVIPEECAIIGDPSGTIESICSRVSDGGILNLPFYGDCHNYWQCRGENVVCLMRCGFNGDDQLVFNPVLGRCDDQWHYPCDIFEPVLPPTS